jgi:cobalt/nickel transport system ATP-binding protein
LNIDRKIFELKNAGFAYQGAPALKDVNLTVSSGEKVCILGANGCGKTTLLRIFAGLSLPQSGSFYAFGSEMKPKTMDDDRAACAYHRSVGFIFQDADAQLFCTSVREEIAFGPLQTGMAAIEAKQRVLDIANLLEIEPLLDKAPFNLSGGEKKKVAIAAVLALAPEVLILDEPTNGLDPRSQRWLINLLVTLGEAGKTIITSTHNLGLAREISTRAVLFDENHTIAKDANTVEVLSDIVLLKRVNLVDESYSG